MYKIILFYKFTPISDPEAIRLWQRSMCEKLNLKSRIIVSKHGINGTLGGKVEDVKAYVKEMKTYAPFKDIVYKWSDGKGDEFPRINVKVRPELVAFGAGDELKVDEKGVVGGGKHLSPEKVNELVEKYGDDVVFFDGRNAYEAQVGRFKNAVVPDTKTTRDFLEELSSDKYNDIKDKKVVTYCTGGIRCEILSSLMKNRGFKDVYQIDGGIVKYGEKYKDDGHWEGNLYVFDQRMNIKFSEKAKDIGECIHCKGRTSNFENCAYPQCNRLVLICKQCHTNKEVCSAECEKKLLTKA